MALITITSLFQMPNPNQQPPSNALSSEVETLYDPQTIAPPKNNLQSEVCEKDGCTEYHAVETHVRNGKLFNTSLKLSCNAHFQAVETTYLYTLIMRFSQIQNVFVIVPAEVTLKCLL